MSHALRRSTLVLVVLLSAVLFDQGRYGFVFFRTDYKGTSFASGHAVTAFSLALALSFLFPKYRVPLFLAAAAVAASRVLLTAHFLGDVVFGAYIGIATVLVLKAVFERRAPLYRLPGSGTSPGT